jgi:hypothetical protein
MEVTIEKKETGFEIRYANRPVLANILWLTDVADKIADSEDSFLMKDQIRKLVKNLESNEIFKSKFIEKSVFSDLDAVIVFNNKIKISDLRDIFLLVKKEVLAILF